MRRGGLAAVLLSVAVLLLAVWVTSTEPVHLLSPGSGSGGGGTPPAAAQVHQPSHRSPTHRPPAPPHTNLWFGPVGYLTLGLVAVGLLIFLATAVVRRNRRQKWATRASDKEVVDAVAALGIPPRLAETTERQLRTIHEGTPRNAIVACWLELDLTCRETGLLRSPAETSTEFTARVLSHYAVAAEAVDTLATLYREARFSEHTLSEHHRRQAVAALEQILTNLVQPSSHESGEVAHA